MKVSYATSSDYTTYAGGVAPSDITRLLLRASELIDSKVTTSFLVNTGTSLPSDATVAAALRDATCAQVEFWQEVSEGNDIDGLAGTQITVSGFTGKRAPRLAPRALDILRQYGLIGASGGGLSRVPWGTGLQ